MVTVRWSPLVRRIAIKVGCFEAILSPASVEGWLVIKGSIAAPMVTEPRPRRCNTTPEERSPKRSVATATFARCLLTVLKHRPAAVSPSATSVPSWAVVTEIDAGQVGQNTEGPPVALLRFVGDAGNVGQNILGCVNFFPFVALQNCACRRLWSRRPARRWHLRLLHFDMFHFFHFSVW